METLVMDNENPTPIALDWASPPTFAASSVVSSTGASCRWTTASG
jgi:hypothetical protein